jgi:hypothetical protein
MFLYVLKLRKSEAKRAGGPLRLALTEAKHIKKHVFVRMGKKCTPASGSFTLPRRIGNRIYQTLTLVTTNNYDSITDLLQR